MAWLARTSLFKHEPGARRYLLHARTAMGDTALSAAAAGGQADMLYELYLAGVQVVDAANRFGATPLHVAAARYRFGAAHALVQLGCGVDARKADGETALHVAAGRGDWETALVLVRAGAAAAVRSASGRTALHRAVEGGQVEIAALLLDAGASIWTQDALGHCPATLAVFNAVQPSRAGWGRGVLNLFAERGLLWTLRGR